MTDDPTPPSLSLPPEDLAQLRARAADAAARLRELVEQSRELRVQAASLCAKNAMLRNELLFRQLGRGKVDRFP
jgi:uncharacterized protein (DUF3084 family)